MKSRSIFDTQCKAYRPSHSQALRVRYTCAPRHRLLLTQPAADTPAGGAAATAATAAAPAGGGAAVASTTAGGAGGGSSSATGGSSSKGAAYAAAATAREARALRGRLLGKIPKLLLGGGAAASATAAAATAGAFQPGAMLFCYSRPPPPPLPPGAAAGAVAAAAKRAAAAAREAYSSRLRDGLRRLGWRGPWHARLAVAAWCRFVQQWQYDTGATAADVVATLAAEWDGGSSTSGGSGSSGEAAAAAAVAGGGGGGGAPVAVLEGVGLAAGAVCLAAEGLSEADVSGLASRLLLQVGVCVFVWVARVCEGCVWGALA